MTPEEIEPQVSPVLTLLQNEIDASAFCPPNSFPLEKAILMVTTKSLRVSLAVCRLVSGRFYGEAFGLTRSVLEAFFIAKYISTKIQRLGLIRILSLGRRTIGTKRNFAK